MIISLQIITVQKLMNETIDFITKDLWLLFDTIEQYVDRAQELFKILEKSKGNDPVVIVIMGTCLKKKKLLL